LRFGHLHTQPGGQKEDITVAEVVIAVTLITPPFHIGNGIPLEEQATSFLEIRQSMIATATSRCNNSAFFS